MDDTNTQVSESLLLEKYFDAVFYQVERDIENMSWATVSQLEEAPNQAILPDDYPASYPSPMKNAEYLATLYAHMMGNCCNVLKELGLISCPKGYQSFAFSSESVAVSSDKFRSIVDHIASTEGSEQSQVWGIDLSNVLFSDDEPYCTFHTFRVHDRTLFIAHNILDHLGSDRHITVAITKKFIVYSQEIIWLQDGYSTGDRTAGWSIFAKGLGLIGKWNKGNDAVITSGPWIDDFTGFRRDLSVCRELSRKIEIDANTAKLQSELDRINRIKNTRPSD